MTLPMTCLRPASFSRMVWARQDATVDVRVLSESRMTDRHQRSRRTVRSVSRREVPMIAQISAQGTPLLQQAFRQNVASFADRISCKRHQVRE
jgi:hypothetical protein